MGIPALLRAQLHVTHALVLQRSLRSVDLALPLAHSWMVLALPVVMVVVVVMVV